MPDIVERSKPYKSKNMQWKRLKKFGNYILDRATFFKAPILWTWRTGKWQLLRCKWRFVRRIETRCGLDMDKTYFVSPAKIIYCSLREFDVYNFKGKIIGGNWDHLEKKFDNLDIFVALKKVCIEGRDWRRTSFYQRVLDELARGEISWNCINESELDKRCDNCCSLYQKIRDSGYKTQAELSAQEKNYNPINIEDEITVSIGRFGDLLFSNCAHRLAIAKLLNIERIPIKIAVRHPRWIIFRKEILDYASRHAGKIYQPIIHPDLSDIPAFHNSEDRFQMIRENLSVKRGGKLLDIGANWGYFCHKFEDEGYDCYAVENSIENLYFLNKLKRAENKNFVVISKSILESNDAMCSEFDVVLALNVLHHFLKREETHVRLVKFLRKLRAREMFFEPHSYREVQMTYAFKNYTNEEFLAFIVHNSVFKYVEYIGKADDDRKLYKLSRLRQI